MATQLIKTTQYNVGVIVGNAVNAVKQVRLAENSRQEAEFQKAVADGMSYADQLKYRTEQLEKVKQSSFPDETYINELEKSVATSKQMVRFEKIRTKYKDALDSYVTGKSSISSYLSILQDSYDSEADETMRTELRSLISSAQQTQATNELNAVKNRALVAEKDNSIGLINDSIDEVKSRRARASISENNDEVAMWDDTLLALNSSKAKLQIENSMNEITFKINKFNPKANDKLGYLNDEIAKADSSGEVTYNGVTYPSLRAYWENARNQYISSGYFDEVKKDMDAETEKIASTSAFGQVPVARIDAVNGFYNTLKSRSEFAPFVDIIEQNRVAAVSKMANDLAESIYSEAGATGDISKAQQAITGIETKFGVAVSREPFNSEIAAGKTIATNTIKAPSTITPATPSTTGAPSGTYTAIAGDSLSVIASKNNISLLQLLDENPEYKANPSMVREGAIIKIPSIKTTVAPQPAPAVAPVAKPEAQPTVAPTQNQTTPANTTNTVVPNAAPAQPVSTPTPPVAPAAPVSNKYTGTSVVDFLKSKGQDSSFAARQKLAQEKGIANYTGAAEQNDLLLKSLNI